jgi:hypothetical protein
VANLRAALGARRALLLAVRPDGTARLNFLACFASATPWRRLDERFC